MENKKSKKSGKNNITEEAYQKALEILKNCSHSLGLKASAKSKGYPQVWSRDSMITLLGAALTKDPEIYQAISSSINTLRERQTDLGLIPNNVDVRSKKTNFQAYADGGLWFVIGNVTLFKITQDKSFLRKNYSSIKKVLRWYEYQDGEQIGLISINEASDWEDLLAVRDKSLYVNTLYFEALKKGAEIAKTLKDEKNQKLYKDRAHNLRLKINEKFWYFKNKDTYDIIRHCFGTKPPAKEKKNPGVYPPKNILKNDSYYLPYITFRYFGEWFDSFGNLLTILTGVADDKQSKQILKFIEKYKLATPNPIEAIYPPIYSNDRDWRYYYKFANLNLPHQYHNGGIWPFLGGFYVAALVKMKKHDEAEKALHSLALLNKKGKQSKWEFNEWCHGKSGQPKGMVEQAWSAGMYIYAYQCVKKKKVLFL